MSDPGEGYGDLGRGRRRLVTFALLSCAFLAMLDGTVIGTALPRIVEQVGGTDSWYVWLVTAYLLTSSVSVPVYGRFSDLYGRRRLLLAGLGLFLAGSLACGTAGSMTALIAARAVQGLGAGALLTLGMALVRDLYPPDRSSGMIRMQSVLGVMMVLGLLGGPLVGGLVTDHADWRWAFWLNLPLGVAAVAVLAIALPERRPGPAPSGRLDVAGILLLAAGLSFVLTGLSLKGNPVDGRLPGWGDPAVAGSLLAGAVLLALLVPVERRAEVPLLPPRLFRRRTYTALLGAGFFFQLAALPVGVMLPLYFQRVRGSSATDSGLMLLPMLGGMALGNRLTAAAVLRSGRARPVLLAGAGLLTVGTGGFFALEEGTPLTVTWAWLLLAGLGTGPAMGGLTIATQNCVPVPDRGSATAGSALAKQAGGAFGLACAQSLTGSHLAGHAGASSAAATTSAVGSTVAWTGVAGGALAFAALLLVGDLAIPVPAPGGGSRPVVGGRRAEAGTGTGTGTGTGAGGNTAGEGQA